MAVRYTVRERRGKYRVIYEDFWERTELEGMAFTDISEALDAAERLTGLARK